MSAYQKQVVQFGCQAEKHIVAVSSVQDVCGVFVQFVLIEVVENLEFAFTDRVTTVANEKSLSVSLFKE